MSNPILYILMRDDLESLNAGKAIAQGAHAANQFVQAVGEISEEDPIFHLYNEWCASTGDGFGTTIVLGASVDEMHEIVDKLKEDQLECVCGITHDPTYPLRDGDVTHLLPLDTCAFVFFDKDYNTSALSALDKFELYP